MLLWQWTLLSLAGTAVLGLVLFSGYTFRVRISYPLALVTGHVIGATLTVILFCLLQYRFLAASSTIRSYAEFFSWVSFATLILTFISGLYFYLRFNVRRRGLTRGMLVTHLLMAAVSFSFALSSVAGVAGSESTTMNFYSSTMYNFHKHQNQRGYHGTS